MDLARKIAVPLMFVLSIDCATARPPDLQRTLQNGSIELVVQKMQRPWRIVEKAGVEGIQLESNQDDIISIRLYPAQKMDPFLAVFGAMMFFTERHPGSKLDCAQKRGQPAYCSGNLDMSGELVHLEVRAWQVAGTETVALVTGMWPEGGDPTWLQDFEAIVAGIHSTKKKK